MIKPSIRDRNRYHLDIIHAPRKNHLLDTPNFNVMLPVDKRYIVLWLFQSYYVSLLMPHLAMVHSRQGVTKHLMLLNIVFNGFTISFLSLHYNMNTKYTIADQSIQKYLLVRHYIRNQCKNLTCNVHMHRHSYEQRLLFS